eukprot:11226815-Lingulodinium_polyedra.AAC.1
MGRKRTLKHRWVPGDPRRTSRTRSRCRTGRDGNTLQNGAAARPAAAGEPPTPAPRGNDNRSRRCAL